MKSMYHIAHPPAMRSLLIVLTVSFLKRNRLTSIDCFSDTKKTKEEENDKVYTFLYYPSLLIWRNVCRKYLAKLLV